MTRPWKADPATTFKRRLGKSPQELGNTTGTPDSPASWELANGDIAVIGRDLTQPFGTHLPDGASLGADERLVVIPRNMPVAAKPDIPSV
ncbi:hypothetical protein ACFV19_27905 [Streptomyces griseoluteus]|uniref:hypothetical protein n=1 Tax=Streptomyces griseoluteus TaxID=29306 RepID=UPI003682F66B